jgi:hypothetical protein
MRNDFLAIGLLIGFIGVMVAYGVDSWDGLASGVGHPVQLTVCIAEPLIFLGGLEERAGIFVAAKTA